MNRKWIGSAALISACVASFYLPIASAIAPYQATITRTTMGIPHIKSNSRGGAGYGYGYAFAQDNLCEFYNDVLTVRGQRSRYFGPDGVYNIPSVPVTATNVNSDFFWKFMATPEAIARTRAGASAGVVEMTAGYTAGINRYITELRAGQHPGRHLACVSAPYLQAIREDDIYARYYRLAIIASSSVFITEIATAQPPALNVAATLENLNTLLATNLLKTVPNPLQAFSTDKPMGSNAYGLSSEATADGSSMLFGNPHFPWGGSERFYMAHLTVPGVMDIEGASLFGVPLILIGFNNQLSWSHTVSSALRFSLYQLLLNPLNPTQYLYDGQIRDMTPVSLSIDVKTATGVSSMQRTLYKTQYGPVLTLSLQGVPILGWDNVRAYTMRDANEVNNRLLSQFYEWNVAPDLDAFKASQKAVLGVPWVNTIATGPGREAYYADISVVPNVPDSLVASCSAPIISTVIRTAAPGLPVLQGQRRDCQWLNEVGAPPGIFGPSHLPALDRNDFVMNSNDSYWLSNPAQPLTGFDRIIGDEGTERTLRTRLGIRQIQDRLSGADGLGGTGFTFDKLKEVVLSSRIYSAELARADVVGSTCQLSFLFNLGEACSVLANWNGRADLDARGEHLWREFWLLAKDKTLVWGIPFNSADPVNTPRQFLGLNPEMKLALSQAQQKVRDAGLSLDARLGDIQKSGVHVGPSIPVFGTKHLVGGFTIADSPALVPGGYKVDYGNSYIQAVTWDVSGKVKAEGFLTYSQSTDPASPHYRDFTKRYAQRNWLRFPFAESEIGADKISQISISAP